MFNYLSNKIDSNIQLTFIMLLFFHALFAIFLFLIASSEYFSNFHNGEGLWNFTRDSWRYHKEAIDQLHFLQNSEWASWWEAYSLHAHVRFISLVYWLTGYETPIVFELVNGFLWTASVILIYRSSKVLFENNTVVPILTVLFFLQPSVLMSSTQLLRDPFQILGLCFLCYGWILIAKTELHLRAVLYIVLGSLIYISMRQYLGMVVLVVFSTYVVYLLLTNKITLVNTAIILLSLLLTVYINMDTGAKRISKILVTEVNYDEEFTTSEKSVIESSDLTSTVLLNRDEVITLIESEELKEGVIEKYENLLDYELIEIAKEKGIKSITVSEELENLSNLDLIHITAHVGRTDIPVLDVDNNLSEELENLSNLELIQKNSKKKYITANEDMADILVLLNRDDVIKKLTDSFIILVENRNLQKIGNNLQDLNTLLKKQVQDSLTQKKAETAGQKKAETAGQKKDETAGVIEYLLIQMKQIENKYSEPRIDKMMRSLRLKEIKSIEDNLAAITDLESNLLGILEASPTNDKKLESLYASVKNSKELLLIQHNQLLINEEEWNAQNVVHKFLDITTWRVLEIRSDFRWVNRGALSVVDPVLQFHGFVDAIAYLPRALQVSFLSPFPANWIEEGRHVGLVGRLLSGLETLVWYVVIIGFIYALVNASFRTIPLIPVLILSTFVIILVGYAVPNMGAIYRMRQDQVIPFYLIGIYGLYSITNRLNNKRSVDS